MLCRKHGTTFQLCNFWKDIILHLVLHNENSLVLDEHSYTHRIDTTLSITKDLKRIDEAKDEIQVFLKKAARLLSGSVYSNS